MALSPDGKQLYVINQFSDTVSVIDTGTNAVLETIPIGSYPSGITVSQNGDEIYVANRFDNDIAIIDRSTYEMSGRIPLNAMPEQIAFVCAK